METIASARLPMALLRIIRPVNCVIAFVAVCIGALSAMQPDYQAQVIMKLGAAALSAALMAAFGNVVNDIKDAAIDAINQPSRPIPSGALSVQCAGYLGLFLLVAGLGVAYCASLTHFAFACCVAALLIAYANWFKATILAGNFVVSVLTGATLVYGGMVGGEWRFSFVPALFAFLINLSREIIKDAEDVAGDAKNNVITFPVRFGIRAGQKLAALPLILLSILVFVPYMVGMFGTLYCVIVAAGVSLPLIVVSFLLYTRDYSRRSLHAFSTILKLVMLAGIVAILLGRGMCAPVFNV